MNDDHYLLDNNVLAKLSRSQRASTFMRQLCRIPGEVLYEARGYLGTGELDSLEYQTTGQVLEIVGEVMSTMPVGDTKLVDLYRNRGNADPFLVACAIDGTRDAGQYLFGPNWVIVSDDLAVRAKPSEFGIAASTSAEFIEMLEAAVV